MKQKKITDPSPSFLGPSIWEAFSGRREGRRKKRMSYTDSRTPIYYIGKFSGALDEIEKITDPSSFFWDPQIGSLFGGKGRLEQKVDVIFGLPDHDLLYREKFRSPR